MIYKAKMTAQINNKYHEFYLSMILLPVSKRAGIFSTRSDRANGFKRELNISAGIIRDFAKRSQPVLGKRIPRDREREGGRL